MSKHILRSTSKQIKAHPIRHNGASFGLREVALTGLGAASLACKQAIRSLTELASIAERLPEASAILVEGIGERALALKDGVLARTRSLRTRARQLAGTAGSEVELRIAPLLVNLGVKHKPAKRKRTVKTTSKAAKKRTARKAA